MLALLLGAGTSCSKRVNKKVPELVKREEALKELKSLDEKVALKARQDAAIPLEKLIISKEDETLASLSLYQIILNSHLLKVKTSSVSVYTYTNTDHDFQKELEQLATLTKRTSVQICENIKNSKKNTLKNDNDLVVFDSGIVQRNVDENIDCRGLEFGSDYITKKELSEICDSIALAEKGRDSKELQKIESIKPEVKANSEKKVDIIAPKLNTDVAPNPNQNRGLDQSDSDIEDNK